ncbi:hypothetical protein PRIPAC_88391 [Pristionchus pacificus]|uniref:Uncharacterized protein n=1 Tax=Pristionchus pacificus TaxID=54126 RepID=A0A2A6B9Q7_PRIPA|nr:hypothetical protein PRIPAC_88391 [Pristionchus pacificus]|eukprot:PDM62615.1 hypothetical protein PRIPAC_52057 [Pristionchus pacificus]
MPSYDSDYLIWLILPNHQAPLSFRNAISPVGDATENMMKSGEAHKITIDGLFLSFPHDLSLILYPIFCSPVPNAAFPPSLKRKERAVTSENNADIRPTTRAPPPGTVPTSFAHFQSSLSAEATPRLSTNIRQLSPHKPTATSTMFHIPLTYDDVLAFERQRMIQQQLEEKRKGFRRSMSTF